MKIITRRYVVSASKPRLSDEEMDLIELDDTEAVHTQLDGWVPWEQEDLVEIQQIISDKMPINQQQIMDAFLLGMTYNDLGVTEKYWRYHYKKAIEFIKKELRL